MSEMGEAIATRIKSGEELLARFIRSEDDLVGLRNNFNTWDEYNLRLLERRFSTTKVAEEYRRVTFGHGHSSPGKELEWLSGSINSQLRKLESISLQLELYASEAPMAQGVSPPAIGDKVFIVHGHDGDTKLQVAEFVERITGERPVILHEQADSGLTIIEKFEAHASEAGFVIVLLTADDVGGSKGAATTNPRARQNVVFEFGYFIGKLSRGRVVALYERGVELPSDVSGMLYKSLAGNWHTDLAKELKAAGLDIDLGKLGTNMPEDRPPIPRPLERDLFVEAGYRCAVPTCRAFAPLQIDHIEDWSRVREHRFENMIVLCANCHGRKGDKRGQIDRIALRQFKANLALLNHRYGEFERRILDYFAANPGLNLILLPAGWSFLFIT